MTRIERLQHLRKLGEKHRQEQEALLSLGTMPVSRQEIREEAADLDSFREHQRDLAADSHALTSDER